MRKEKILIFIPAYNVEKKITKVLNKIPKIVFNKYNIKIIVIEDNSSDKTLSVIKKVIKNKGDKIKIYLIVNKKNKGYGDEISHLKTIPYAFNILRCTILSRFKN